ncbi:MAG: TonB-dependent siderophore receptor [Alphaproteobacteria bacterium]|nr:MAG: TonB-dependent siderophore receptor [Alphaproteobacteria bacterium]
MNFRAFLISSVAGFALLSSTAQAQISTQKEEMGEIVVTGQYITNKKLDSATGLGLSVLETPQSISILTAQRILDQNIDTMADVIRNSTGVAVNEIDDVRNTFNSRGFDINNYQVDGVPLAYTLAGGAGETVLDVSIYERIEIVRGATGLLTGVGDPSASVNLVRKHADAEELTGYVNASIGSWSNFQLSADIANAVTQSGRVRARGVIKYEKGETNVNLLEQTKLVLYGTVAADLTDNTTVTIGASHQRTEIDAPAWGALPAWYADGSFAQWPREQTSSANWTYWDTTNQNVFANLTHTFANDWELIVNYNWLRNAQQTQILYLFGQVDQSTGLGLLSFPYSDDGENTQNTFDIQLKGGYNVFGREHEFSVGALQSKQKYDNSTFTALAFPGGFSYYDIQDGSFPNPGFSTTPTIAVDFATKETGFYGVTRLNLSDKLKVIGGARLSSWKRKGFDFGPDFDFGDNGVFIPYVGALYDVAHNHTVYASFTEIFKPQNARDENGDYLDPVTGSNYEMGLKSTFLDGAIQSSIALFQIEQDNLSESTGQMIPGTIIGISRAIEGATSKGFEAEIAGHPTENWNIIVGFSHFNIEDKDGTEIATEFPHDLFNAFTTYSFMDTLEGLTIGGGVNWRGTMYDNTTNPVTGDTFRLEQKSYALLNLMARYAFSDTLSVQANIDNVADKTYLTQVGFFDQYRYGKPRKYSVALNYTF